MILLSPQLRMMFTFAPFLCAAFLADAAGAPVIIDGSNSKEAVTMTTTAASSAAVTPSNVYTTPFKVPEVSSVTAAVSGDRSEKAVAFCTTLGCNEVRNLIEKSINRDVDPCEDFDEFACGSWRAARNKTYNYDSTAAEAQVAIEGLLDEALRAIKPKQTRHIFSSSEEQSDTPSETESGESLAFQQARDFYLKCKESGPSVSSYHDWRVLQFIREFAAWPLLSENATWNSDRFDLNKVIGDLHRRLGVSPFLRPYASTDWKNPTRNTIYLEVGKLDLTRTYMLNRKRFRYSMDYRRANVQKSLYNLIVALLPQRSKTAFWLTTSVAESIADFEQEIARNVIPATAANMHNLLDLESLASTGSGSSSEESLNYFDPRKSLRSALSDVEWSWLGAESETRQITVESPDNLRFLTQLLNRTPKHVVANYLLWQMLIELSPYLGRNYSLAASYAATEKVQCTDRVVRFFPEVTDHLVLQKVWTPQFSSLVADIKNKVRTAAKSFLQYSRWLSSKSRARAIVKLEKIAFNLGPSKKMPSATPYTNYLFRDSFFENFLSLLNESRDLNAATISAPTKRKQVLEPMSQVNGFNYKDLNLVTIPAAQLLKPFASAEYPAFFSFGRAGTTIGHEIGHSFDPTGLLYDQHGAFKPSWILDSYTAEKYESLRQCEYSKSCFRISLEDAITGMPRNGSICVYGSQTLDENMADFFGIQAAYQAYDGILRSTPAASGLDGPLLHGLTEYSPTQLFFIAYGTRWCSVRSDFSRLKLVSENEHSPESLRINNVLGNMPAFSKAFKCKPNQAMYSTEESVCSVWSARPQP